MRLFIGNCTELQFQGGSKLQKKEFSFYLALLSVFCNIESINGNKTVQKGGKNRVGVCNIRYANQVLFVYMWFTVQNITT